MSVKGRMLRALSGFLREARVSATEAVGPDFRRVVLSLEAPVPPDPGTKVQVLLPSDDVRTYTPLAAPEGMVLLGYVHATGPGAAWIRSAKVGDGVHFVGPQKSLVLPPGPLIVVGDETSVAVASSFERASPGRVVRAVFEAGNVEATEEAARAVGLSAVHAAPRGSYAALVQAIAEARGASADAVIALTGGSELVLGVREGLRARAISDIKTKTYWIPGRAGLD